MNFMREESILNKNKRKKGKYKLVETKWEEVENRNHWKSQWSNQRLLEIIKSFSACFSGNQQLVDAAPAVGGKECWEDPGVQVLEAKVASDEDYTAIRSFQAYGDYTAIRRLPGLWR